MKIEGINSLLRCISEGRARGVNLFSLLSHIHLSKAYLFWAGEVYLIALWKEVGSFYLPQQSIICLVVCCTSFQRTIPEIVRTSSGPINR